MQQEIFITEIKINNVRHLHDVSIPIVKEGGKMKHLILTGKNGSGKTSLLEAIATFIDISPEDDMPLPAQIQEIKEYEQAKKKSPVWDKEIDLGFNQNKFNEGDSLSKLVFVKAYFGATRRFILDKPNNIEKVQIPSNVSIKANYSYDFLKYLVFLRSKLTDASYRQDLEEVKNLEKWFNDFESTLKEIFKDDDLRLEYDSSNLNFNIIQTDKSLFDFNTLSDGYAAILRILTELMMRMENKKADAYDVNGIVLIDEIETHLHIELQKSILPFLTAFFPKVQFIVSTHSPFILNSIENAVVYDLENHILFEDASELSYSGLIEKYFLTSQYSDLMEKKIAQFETLVNNEKRTEVENKRMAELFYDLKTLSPLLSPEMYNRFKFSEKKILRPISYAL